MSKSVERREAVQQSGINIEKKCIKCGLGLEVPAQFINTNMICADCSEPKKESIIDRAKKEIADFNKLILEVWEDELTDRQELLCLRFYDAGIKKGMEYEQN